MALIYQPQEIAAADGTGTGRWRMTVRSDESQVPPRGLCEHEHDSPQDASDCRVARMKIKKEWGFSPRGDRPVLELAEFGASLVAEELVKLRRLGVPDEALQPVRDWLDAQQAGETGGGA